MIASIESLQHPLVKHLVKLRTNRPYRYDQQRVVIEGLKMVMEVGVQHPLVTLLVTSRSLIPPQIKAERIFVVPETVMQKLSGLESSEGILAEVKMPAEGSLDKKKWVVALDNINDPGNMGTLLRTALALNWEACFLLDNCCDPYNEKALRSAKGATFRLPLIRGTWDQLRNVTETFQWQALAADLEGEPPEKISTASSRLLVLGSESHGISQQAFTFCVRVSLPMSDKMESLNVSVAGGILMYVLHSKES